MNRLFVSRDLGEESPLVDLAKAHHLHCTAQPLIEFSAVEFKSIPDCEWVFFYSKRGVQFFFQGLNQLDLKIQAKIAVMGLGTLNALKPFGKSADFAGNGHPQQVAEAFAILARGQRVLFPRAQASRKSIQTLLQNDITVKDLVVYNNHYRNDFELPKMDFLVFTSPMNAVAYFNKYPLFPGQKVFAIGQTTAQQLYDLGISNVYISDHPSEKALAKLLKSHL